MSLHIGAEQGAIAETVFLPGDPLRAKWIAENFLQDAVCYNEIRGMLGYTGYYKGQRISVQGTGMGIPSTLIYCHELITKYGVKNLIRIGSAGSYQKEIKLRDLVIAMSASTTSRINRNRFPEGDFSPTADFELFQKAINYAAKNDIAIKAGNVLSEDEFYGENPDSYKKWADYGVLCVEMEAAGLYTIAVQHGVKALAILSISDSLITGEELSSEDREKSFDTMVKLALGSVTGS